MAAEFIVQEWDNTDRNNIVDKIDRVFNTLAKADEYYTNTVIPTNHQRTILYRLDGETTLRLYKHTLSKHSLSAADQKKVEDKFTRDKTKGF